MTPITIPSIAVHDPIRRSRVDPNARDFCIAEDRTTASIREDGPLSHSMSCVSDAATSARQTQTSSRPKFVPSQPHSTNGRLRVGTWSCDSRNYRMRISAFKSPTAVARTSGPSSAFSSTNVLSEKSSFGCDVNTRPSRMYGADPDPENGSEVSSSADVAPVPSRHHRQASADVMSKVVESSPMMSPDPWSQRSTRCQSPRNQ